MVFTSTDNRKTVGNLGTGNSNADCLMLIGCSNMSTEGFGLYMFRWQKENSVIGNFTECVGGRLNYVTVTPHYFNELHLNGLKPDLTYYVNIISIN